MPRRIDGIAPGDLSIVMPEVEREKRVVAKWSLVHCSAAVCAESAAMPIRSFKESGGFEPEIIAAMSEALEAAFEKLQDTGEPDVVRERVATRIIAAAKLGERDPARSLAAALRKSD